jgi:hypothetical protein
MTTNLVFTKSLFIVKEGFVSDLSRTLCFLTFLVKEKENVVCGELSVCLSAHVFVCDLVLVADFTKSFQANLTLLQFGAVMVIV